MKKNMEEKQMNENTTYVDVKQKVIAACSEVVGNICK